MVAAVSFAGASVLTEGHRQGRDLDGGHHLQRRIQELKLELLDPARCTAFLETLPTRTFNVGVGGSLEAVRISVPVPPTWTAGGVVYDALELRGRSGGDSGFFHFAVNVAARRPATAGARVYRTEFPLTVAVEQVQGDEYLMRRCAGDVPRDAQFSDVEICRLAGGRALDPADSDGDGSVDCALSSLVVSTDPATLNDPALRAPGSLFVGTRGGAYVSARGDTGIVEVSTVQGFPGRWTVDASALSAAPTRALRVDPPLACPAGNKLVGFDATGAVCASDAESPAAPSIYTGSGEGSGDALLANVTPGANGVFQFKGLTAGAGITVTQYAERVVVGTVGGFREVSPCPAGQVARGVQAGGVVNCVTPNWNAAAGGILDRTCTAGGACNQLCIGGDCRASFPAPTARTCFFRGQSYTAGARCRETRPQYDASGVYGSSCHSQGRRVGHAMIYQCEANGQWSRSCGRATVPLCGS